MVLNRLLGCAQPREPPEGPEYYVLLVARGTLMISRGMARSVMNQLLRWRRPRWIRVVDLSGAEIWLRPESVELVGESTPEQREYDRQLRRHLDAEDNSGEAPAWG